MVADSCVDRPTFKNHLEEDPDVTAGNHAYAAGADYCNLVKLRLALLLLQRNRATLLGSFR
jgi:hypothetical protein